jgi:hypothetical protein
VLSVRTIRFSDQELKIDHGSPDDRISLIIIMGKAFFLNITPEKVFYAQGVNHFFKGIFRNKVLPR